MNRQMNRSQWRASYRAHRAADKLWSFLCRKDESAGVPSFVAAVPGWQSFESTRLRGDRLAEFPLRDQLSHTCRMFELSLRPRLPA